MKCLNLGCGARFHPQWTNLDLTPSGQNVRAYDCRQPLPFEDESFDVVYHSHLIEHLRREDVIRFLRECCRVLRPGGILRVAIPDLEGIRSEERRVGKEWCSRRSLFYRNAK